MKLLIRAKMLTMTALETKKRERELLIVEDNQSDIDIMIEAFNLTLSNKNINVVTDGDEAISYIHKMSNFQSMSKLPKIETPDLILMDINLPSYNGVEVLKLIKTDDNLKHIPVIMLTTSRSDRDVRNCYGNYANSFFCKPSNLQQFVDLINLIDLYWLQTASLSTNLLK